MLLFFIITIIIVIAVDFVYDVVTVVFINIAFIIVIVDINSLLLYAIFFQ